MTEQGGYDYSMKSDKYKNRKHTSWKTFREIIGSYLAVVVFLPLLYMAMT